MSISAPRPTQQRGPAVTIRDAADAVDNVILTTAAVWLALTYVGVCLLIVNTFNDKPATLSLGAGELAPAIDQAFADATRWTGLAAAFFVLIGLGSSMFLPKPKNPWE